MKLWKKGLACALAMLTLAASISTASAASQTQTSSPFTDIPGLELRQAVDGLYAAGIMKGVAADKFNPNGVLTRAELVTILGRAAGAEVDQTAKSAFTDVVNDGWSAGYIDWANQNGLVLGSGDGTFHQYSVITKEEVNLVLSRYNEKFGTQINLYPVTTGNVTRGNIAVLLAGGLTYEKTEPVSVTGGEIVGYYAPDGQVQIYKGIPYAAAPVGDLRWKAPQAVEPWEGVRSCVNWSASAIQPEQAPFMFWTEEFIIEDTGYSEDCLYLNVWTTGGDTADKPVIVYIHGGGFTSGGSSCEVYDGTYMAQQGAVYVSINYRVGVMGYLATSALSAESENGVSGNYGLLDQIAALQWVQDNISAFGGDPGNVTIMGQSAGAMSVNALLQSPLTKGLFAKAASLSSQAVNDNTYTQDLAVVEAQNDATFGSYTLAELRAMTPDEVMAIGTVGTMCIDGYVLTEDFAAALQDGTANDVPLMIGKVPGDTMLFTGLVSSFMVTSVETYEQTIRTVFGEQADAALEIYPATEETLAAVIDELNVDNMLALQNIVLVRAREKGGDSATYTYMMDYVMPDMYGGIFGAFHTSDVPYFLNILSDWRADYWTEADQKVADTMSAYLLNFARTGNPNGTGLPQWAAATGEGDYLLLNTASAPALLSAEKTELFLGLYSDLLT